MIVSKIGRTYERRDLVLVKVSNNFAAENPVILVDCGAHAREWAAVAAGLALLHDLVWDVNGLLDGVDWYIIPNVNPDGYEYSRNTVSIMFVQCRYVQWLLNAQCSMYVQ